MGTTTQRINQDDAVGLVHEAGQVTFVIKDENGRRREVPVSRAWAVSIALSILGEARVDITQGLYDAEATS